MSVAVTVVLPLQDDPTAVVTTAVALAEQWPAGVDAELVVACGPLSTRDRTVLGELEGDVRLVQGDDRDLGALVAAAAGSCAPVLLVVLPGAVLSAAQLVGVLEGDDVEGAVLVAREEVLGTPVLTSARDLPSFAALVGAVLRPAPPVPLPAPPPALADGEVVPGLLSVVVATRDSSAELRLCLDQLRQHTRRPHEVVVVDAGSRDGTAAALAGRRDVRVVRAPRGTGHDAALNLAVQASRGEHVVLLDAATVVHRGWAEGLLRPLEQDPAVVGVGARSTTAPGLQAADVAYRSGSEFKRTSDTWRRRHAGEVSDVEGVAGPVVALRRSALAGTGLLHEVLDTDGHALTELSARLAAAGGRLVVADEVLVHQEALTRWSSSTLAPAEQLQVLRALLVQAGRPLLSATLIVKDEQRSLAVCLASLRGVVDEVVVSDTGSRDRTVEVAEAMGARVVHRAWTDDFGAARNHAHEHARGSWALYLDADERLVTTPEDAGRLAEELLTTSRDGLAAPLHHLSQAGGSVDIAHDVVRVLRRATLQWRGVVHETPVRRDGGVPSVAAVALLHVEHTGYHAEVYAEKDKSGRNLHLAREAYERSLVDEGGRWRWKGAYEMARVLVRQPGAEGEVEARLLECLEGVPDVAFHLRADALVRLADLRLRTDRPVDALAPAREAVALLPANGRPALTLALVHVALEQPATALDVLEAFSAATTTSSGDAHDVVCEQVTVPTLRARLLLQDGRAAEALPLLVSALADQPAWFSAWGALQEAVQAVTPDGWAPALGVVCAPAPERALAAFAGLADADRAGLAEGLRTAGVDAETLTPEARYRSAVDAALHGHSDDAVAAAALALEEAGSHAHALELWEHLPATPSTSVARARCLVALDRSAEAVRHLDGLQVEGLPAPDLLLVAALAASVGDTEAAVTVLQALPPLEPALAAEAAALVAALGQRPEAVLLPHVLQRVPA